MKEITLYECAETTSETTSTFNIFEVIHYDIHRPLLCCQQREEDLGSWAIINMIHRGRHRQGTAQSLECLRSGNHCQCHQAQGQWWRGQWWWWCGWRWWWWRGQRWCLLLTQHHQPTSNYCPTDNYKKNTAGKSAVSCPTRLIIYFSTQTRKKYCTQQYAMKSASGWKTSPSLCEINWQQARVHISPLCSFLFLPWLFVKGRFGTLATNPHNKSCTGV